MLKKLLAKKTLLTVVIVAIVILAVVIVGIVVNQDSEDTGKSGVSIGTEKDMNDTKENMDEESVYNGEGLEVMDEVDETVEDVDGSGSWDEKPKRTQEEQDNVTDDKEIDDTEQDDSSNKENVDEVPEEEILVDDKIWGDIS